MTGPSRARHCELDKFAWENVGSGAAVYEAGLVLRYANMIEVEIVPDPGDPDLTPPAVYRRHAAAILCAEFIRAGDCTFYRHGPRTPGGPNELMSKGKDDPGGRHLSIVH